MPREHVVGKRRGSCGKLEPRRGVLREDGEEGGEEGGEEMGREEGGEVRDLGGVGEGAAGGVEEGRRSAGRKGGGDVGGVGFEKETAWMDGGEDAAGALVAGTGDGAPQGDVCILFGKCREDVGGAAVGMEKDAGGVGGLREDEVEEGRPCAAPVQGYRAAEVDGEVPLGAEGGPLGGCDAAGEGAVEAGFADTGAGMGEKQGTQAVGPAGSGVGGVPGVDAERHADGGGIGPLGGFEGGGGGPVGFAGGVGVDVGYAGFAREAEDVGQVRREARVLKVAMGVGEGHGRGF